MTLASLSVRLRGRLQRSASVHLAQRPVRLQPPKPVISFTFDDFPQTAAQVGGAILSQYNVRGTFYTSLGLMGRETPSGPAFVLADLQQIVSDGHELGCHTFEHCHAWSTAPDIFERSIMRNVEALSSLLPDARFESHSYPIASPHPWIKRRTAKHFACSRGGGQKGNHGYVDANRIDAYFLEQSGGDLIALERLIEDTRRDNAWLVFATHDVAEAPSRFGCTPRLFEHVVRCAVDTGASILPVGEAFRLVRAPGKGS